MKTLISRIYFPIILILFLSFSALVPISHGVTVIWDRNTEDDLAGYKVYYGDSPKLYRSVVDVGNVTEYRFRSLNEGVTYYIAITAYDTSDNESGKSNEACINFISIQNYYFDNDCDGIFDDEDNCTETPNGPDDGTCICGGEPCVSDGECECGSCSMNNEDTDNDGSGDVCDPTPYAELCQSYCNLCNCCVGLQDAGRNVDIFDCYFGGYITQEACEAAGCAWWTERGRCVMDICLGDLDGNTKVKAQERSILLQETGRTDCPCESSSDDICQQYLEKYNCCLGLDKAGRNVDIFDCYYGGYDTKEACEAAGCTWWADSNRCVNDMCIGDFNRDITVKGQERNILLQETGRSGCPTCL